MVYRGTAQDHGESATGERVVALASRSIHTTSAALAKGLAGIRAVA